MYRSRAPQSDDTVLLDAIMQGLTSQLGSALSQSVSQGANVGTIASAVSAVRRLTHSL